MMRPKLHIQTDPIDTVIVFCLVAGAIFDELARWVFLGVTSC